MVSWWFMAWLLLVPAFVCFIVGQLLAFLGWRIDLSEFRGIMTGVGWVNDGPLLPGLCSSHLLDGFSKRQLDVGSSLCFHWAIDLCHAIYCTTHKWAGELEKNSTWPKNGHLGPKRQEFRMIRVHHRCEKWTLLLKVHRTKKEISNSEIYSRSSNVKQVKNQEFETKGQCQDDQSDD